MKVFSISLIIFLSFYFLYQVKLAHQESELVSLLKKIPLGQAELNMVRQRAAHLRDGVLRSRGHALLPIILASFIFDTLNTPSMFVLDIYACINKLIYINIYKLIYIMSLRKNGISEIS